MNKIINNIVMKSNNGGNDDDHSTIGVGGGKQPTIDVFKIKKKNVQRGYPRWTGFFLVINDEVCCFYFFRCSSSGSYFLQP